MVKKPDWKYIGSAIFLITASTLVYLFSDEIIALTRSFFEIKNINLFAGGVATIIAILHKLKTRKIRFSPGMSFNEFRKPFEDIFSFISNPITIVCSISLAKGLFLHSIDSKKYFPYFEKMELSFIGLVTAYLLFISIMELVNNVRETFLLGSIPKSNPTPIPENEVDDEVPNPI